MGMHTSVVGIKPPDAKWKTMKAVWDACEYAGVAPPEEVRKFFGFDAPDEKGVIVDLKGCTAKYSAEMEDGLEIDLTKLPADVKIIRFVNSY